MDIVPTIEEEKDEEFGVPWFPRHPQSLDRYANKTAEFSEKLETDHPGFHDSVYRERRAMIVKKAKEYRYGNPLPDVDYKSEEKETWKQVFSNLKKLYPTHACAQFRECFSELEKQGIYSENEIPQLQNVSQYLKEKTGFQLRPVQGLLTPREFLNGLAFRVFHSTQYIRHHSRPMYTPEPDVCHELIGHVPLFADPQFAQFSQEIGLASLGASDTDIVKLATCYWFSVEFGVCKEVVEAEKEEKRAYGAGLLSSFGELEYCLTEKPQFLPFEPAKTCFQTYCTTDMQPLYFVADSFGAATKQMREFANTMHRPFQADYDCSTETLSLTPVKVTNAEEGAKENTEGGMVGSVPPAWC